MNYKRFFWYGLFSIFAAFPLLACYACTLAIDLLSMTGVELGVGIRLAVLSLVDVAGYTVPWAFYCMVIYSLVSFFIKENKVA